MNITSILITIIGIIIILVLYVISRIGQSHLPKKEVTLLPEIKDDKGNPFTSILNDIPATDGSVSHAKATTTAPQTTNDEATTESAQQHADEVNPNHSETSTVEEPTQAPAATQKQVVLFIAAKEGQELDGNLIKQALLSEELRLGAQDLYHYYIESPQQTHSLFKIANGVEPWTLTDADLTDKRIPGLSMLMELPNVIDNTAAAELFLAKADALAAHINAELKNQKQQILTAQDRHNIMTL